MDSKTVDEITLAGLLSKTPLDSKERGVVYTILNSQGYNTVQRLRESTEWKNLVNKYVQEQISLRLQDSGGVEFSPIRIFVSGRALFFMEDEHKTYINQGKSDFDTVMCQKEKDVLLPGVTMPFIQMCCQLNKGATTPYFDIHLITEISGTALKRVYYSLGEYGITDVKVKGYEQIVSSTTASVGAGGIPTIQASSSSSLSSSSLQTVPLLSLVSSGSSGSSKVIYENTFNRILVQQPDLFIGADINKVRIALAHGIPAALVTPKETPKNMMVTKSTCLNLAFDYDNCLVDDQSEINWNLLQNETSTVRLYKYWNQEYSKRYNLQKEGNLLSFLLKLTQLRNILPNSVFLSLITARNRKACFRVMNTLDSFGVDFDVYTFGIFDKAKALESLQRPIHMFFDDQRSTVDKVSNVFPAARVPAGVTNISTERCSSELS